MKISKWYERFEKKYSLLISSVDEKKIASNTGVVELVKLDKEESGFDFLSCQVFRLDGKNRVLVGASKVIDDLFFLLCFIEKKENCQDVEAMEILTSDLSSKDGYIALIRNLAEKRKVDYRDVVLFDEDKTVLDENIPDSEYVSFVSECDDYFEIYSFERGRKKVEAVIYDQVILFQYLLNKQLYLLRS